MCNLHRCRCFKFVIASICAVLALQVTGCGPTYWELRYQGQQEVIKGAYGPAAAFFKQADQVRPRRVENLHDLGACRVMLAREKFEQMNHAAAMRELDAAIEYYAHAIDVHPGHQASLEGKAVALKLKGQFDEAVEHAEWAAEFVGPSARQYLFLARELEQRDDGNGAFLRYRQAVVVEPDNAEAHLEFAKFLLNHKKEGEAVHHLQMAYRLDPANSWVMSELIARGALPPLSTDEQQEP